jgi:hypothetical protein
MLNKFSRVLFGLKLSGQEKRLGSFGLLTPHAPPRKVRTAGGTAILRALVIYRPPKTLSTKDQFCVLRETENREMKKDGANDFALSRITCSSAKVGALVHEAE